MKTYYYSATLKRNVTIPDDEISSAASAMGKKGGAVKSARKTAAARANARNAGPVHTGVVIFSGEGDYGTYWAWPGEHSESRIKARLTRERSGGDRWARAFVPMPGYVAADGSGDVIYREIITGSDERQIPAGSIL